MLAGATSLLLVAVIAIVSAVVIDRARRHERKEKLLAGLALEAEKVAKAEARRERAQAEANYRLARGVVDQLVTRLAESRRLQDPANATLRLELIGLARRFYLQFIRRRGPDALAKLDLAASYQKLAQAAGVLGDPALAIDQSHHAIQILSHLERSGTHGRLASLRLAEALDNLGKFQVQTRRFEEAERTFLKALKVVDRPEGWPDPDQADARQHLESSIRGDLALAQMDLGQLDRANQSLDALLESDEGYSKSRPGDLEARDGLATTLARLGLALMARGRLDRADPFIRRAAVLTSSSPETAEKSPPSAITASNCASLLGDIEMLQRQFAPARDDYDSAVRQAEAALATGSEVATARSALSRALAGRAGALAALGRYSESLADWDRALEHADPREAPIIRLGRAETLAERGDYLLAVATLESLLKGLPESTDIPFFAARAYAVASHAAAQDQSLSPSEREVLVERYAHAALEHLSLALRHRAGSEPRNLIDLRHARGWDPLRHRRDFQDLMLDLAFPKNAFATDVRSRQAPNP
ncbi:hypothetical protein [Singulisphaera sp. PoT]|uniref:hypothetical protein n=1 Tax=Singulisphaera sp. PoT TaxID=3411797 RepID=UPI003BF61D06